MFSSLDGMFKEAITASALRPVLESRAGEMREELGWVARMTSTAPSITANRTRRMSPIYACAEFLWYMSGSEMGDMMVAYAPRYASFLDEKGKARGAYGHRWSSPPFGPIFNDKRSNLENVIECLGHENSRQSVLSTFWPTDVVLAAHRQSKDVPCTIALQFLLRNDSLHLITTMRSNDVWLGLPYDVFCFRALQSYVANCLRVNVGWYQHEVGSLHLYERNVENALKALNSSSGGDVIATSYRPMSDPRLELDHAVRCENGIRTACLERDERLSFDDVFRLAREYTHGTLARLLVVSTMMRWLSPNEHIVEDDLASCIGCKVYARMLASDARRYQKKELLT